MIEPGFKCVIHYYLSFNLSDNNLEVFNKIKYLWHDDDDDDIHKRHKMCAQKCVVCVQMEMSLYWAFRTPSYTPHSWTNNTTWISSLNSATLQPLSLRFQLSTRGVHSVDSRRSIGLNTWSDGNQVTWLIYSKSYYNITVLLQARPSNSVIK